MKEFFKSVRTCEYSPLRKKFLFLTFICFKRGRESVRSGENVCTCESGRGREILCHPFHVTSTRLHVTQCSQVHLPPVTAWNGYGHWLYSWCRTFHPWDWFVAQLEAWTPLSPPPTHFAHAYPLATTNLFPVFMGVFLPVCLSDIFLSLIN